MQRWRPDDGDTEESTSLYTKSEADKLARFICPYGTVVTGGSGDAHLIDCATQELSEFFRGTPPPSVDIKAKLNEFAQNFFRDTTGQYSGLATELVPSLAMLIAINFNQHTWLFRWTHNRVLLIPSGAHTSVGAGDAQVHPMLRDVRFLTPPSCDGMLLYGTRIMLQAKRMVQGVGGKTEAIALHDGARTHFYGSKNMRLVEELVSEIEDFNIGLAYAYVSGSMQIEENAAESVIEDVPNDFRRFRDRYRQLVGHTTPLNSQMSTDRQSPYDAACR